MVNGDLRDSSGTTELTENRHWVDRMLFGPASVALRVKFFLTGCLFPALCVAFVVFAGGPPTIDAPWQSGRISDYVAVLLTWPCLLAFVPLMLVSMVSLASWTISPATSRYIFVRWGIYSGVLLAAQYLYFIIETTSILTFIFAAIVAPLFAVAIFLVVYFAKRFKRFSILHLLLFTTVIAILCGILQLADAWQRVLESPLIVAAATPTLNFVTYVRASMMIVRERVQNTKSRKEGSLSLTLTLVSLFAAWIVSWRIEIDIMLAEYAKLPTTNPNCYLSAAANHRHSWLFHRPSHKVSLQTKRLKFLEITLCCLSPRLHFALRSKYDRFGPSLAKCCRGSPWFADATYLALVPLEIAAEVVRLQLGVSAEDVRKCYRK